jgi:hypothetical protein
LSSLNGGKIKYDAILDLHSILPLFICYTEKKAKYINKLLLVNSKMLSLTDLLDNAKTYAIGTRDEVRYKLEHARSVNLLGKSINQYSLFSLSCTLVQSGVYVYLLDYTIQNKGTSGLMIPALVLVGDVAVRALNNTRDNPAPEGIIGTIRDFYQNRIHKEAQE